MILLKTILKKRLKTLIKKVPSTSDLVKKIDSNRKITVKKTKYLILLVKSPVLQLTVTGYTKQVMLISHAQQWLQRLKIKCLIPLV